MLYQVDEIPSTNTYLKNEYNKYDDSSILWALKQTEGRGRYTRKWESADDLTFSIIFKEKYNSAIITPLAIIYALNDYKINAKIKWPNDIYLYGGKLAGILKGKGRKVLIGAADTFRAAAGEQLKEWADRADCPIICAAEGTDPASVVFDAVNAAKARNVDVLLIDTAGRLHNKKNLMEELKKMNRIIDREYPDAHRENLIVLDGTTGQNAMMQAKEFGEVANLTGIILTKMDGTAKGGIAIAIKSELKVPVKYIGVGETIDDLQKFDSNAFVNALFDIDNSEE